MSSRIFNIIESAGIMPAAMALSTEDALKRIDEELAGGADINELDKWGGSTLIAACMKDLGEIALHLLDKGVDPTVVDTSDTRSALHYAAENATFPVVERLIAAKVNLDGQDYKGLTPLYMLCLGAKDKFNIRNPKVTDSAGNNVEDSPFVKEVLQKNAHVLETARALIAAGADITLGPNKQPCHFVATQSGNTELLKILLDAGLDVNATDKFTCRPLHYTARGGMRACLEQLLEAGAEPDYQDECGFTALHEAVMSNSADCVALLVEKGASPTLKLGKGFKPYTNHENAIDIAKDKGFSHLVELLT